MPQLPNTMTPSTPAAVAAANLREALGNGLRYDPVMQSGKSIIETQFEQFQQALLSSHETELARVREEVVLDRANLARADEKIEELQAYIRGNQLASAADIITDRDTLAAENAKLRAELAALKAWPNSALRSGGQAP